MTRCRRMMVHIYKMTSDRKVAIQIYFGSISTYIFYAKKLLKNKLHVNACGSSLTETNLLVKSCP